MSFDISSLDHKLELSTFWLEKEFSQISTGRATPALLDSIRVESFGSQQPLKNIASISLEDARTLRVVPWDKSHIHAIEKSLQTSGLPFGVSVNDGGIRISIPQLTEETRVKLVKVLKDKLEQARVSVRKERQDIVKEIENAEKTKSINSDERDTTKATVQKKVDKVMERLDALFTAKETEVLKV